MLQKFGTALSREQMKNVKGGLEELTHGEACTTHGIALHCMCALQLPQAQSAVPVLTCMEQGLTHILDVDGHKT